MAAVQSLKDKDLQAYYEALSALYSAPGWVKLLEDMAYMRLQHDRLDGIETSEQLHFRKGQVNQMDWLLNHQAASEFAYNQILLEEQDGDVEEEEKPTGGRAVVVG